MMDFNEPLLIGIFTDDELELLMKRQSDFENMELLSDIDGNQCRGQIECKRLQFTDNGSSWFKWHCKLFRKHNGEPSETSSQLLPTSIREMDRIEKNLDKIANDAARLINEFSENCEVLWTAEMLKSIFTAIPELESLQTMTILPTKVDVIARDIADELNAPQMAIERHLNAIIAEPTPNDDQLERLAAGQVAFNRIERSHTVKMFALLWNGGGVSVQQPRHLINFAASNGNESLSSRQQISLYQRLFGKQ